MPALTRRLLAAVASLVAAAGGAVAQTYTWTQPATGTSANWSTSTNWSPGAPPLGGSNATILQFNGAAVGGGTANSFAFTNDIGGLTANSLRVYNATVGTGTTGAALTLAQGANQLTLDGAAPSIQLQGPANALLTATAGGGLTLNAATTVSGSGAGYFSVTAPVAGTVAGTALTINTSGTSIFNLSGANTYFGGVNLVNGVLQLGSASALGDASNTLTVGGGALRFGAASVIPNNMTLSQTLVVAGGAGTLTGTSTPTLSGVLSGSGGVRVQSVSGGLTLTGANTYTGATTVSPAIPANPATTYPTFTVSGAAGAIASTQPITIGRNATLSVVNATGADLPNRIPDAAPIVFNGGRFAFTGLTTSSETLGAVTLRGAGLITASPTGTGSVVNFGALTRDDNAGMLLSSTNIGPLAGATSYTTFKFASGVTALAASGTTQIPIVPWAAGSSSTNPRNLVTYDATNGLALVPYDNAAYFDQISTSAGLLGAADRNVSLANATYNLGGGTLQVNALTVQTTGATITNGTLQIYSGAYTNYDPVDWNNVTLAFGPRTGYITAGWQQKFTGTSQITGSAGVAIYGQGAGTTYTLGFENAGGNPFTGGLFVNGNTTVGFRSDNQLGSAGGNITLGGGLLSYNAAADLNISRNIKINEANGGFTFGVVGGAAAASTHTAATVLTLSGVVSGNGAFIKEGTGVVALTGTNTYSGGTVVNAGTLRVSADANLGAAAGKVTLNGGTLQTTAALTTARGIDVGASSSIQADAALTLSGAVANVGALYGTALPTLTKTGTAGLALTGDLSQLSGNVTVAAGNLTLGGSAAAAGGAPQVANWTVGLAGSTLTLDNTGAWNPDRVGDQSRVRLTAAGVVSYLAPSVNTGATAERIGVLEASANGGVFTVTGGSASPTIIRLGSLVANNSITLRGDGLGGTTGNYTRILIDSFTSDQTVIPNVFFANSAGTAASTQAAGYDFTGGKGIVLFTPQPTTGTSINNVAAPNTPLTAAYTTTGNTTAFTGASVYSLTLDQGSTLTLNGGNAAQSGNGQTPDGTLSISGGVLTSQNGAKSVVSSTAGTGRIVSFGGSVGQVTTTSALTLSSDITLAGTGGLTKLGTDTLTVNGTYAVTGPTVVSAGTLAFGQSATVQDLSGTGTVAVGTNALTVNATTATTFAGVLTGTGSLTKTGTGVYTLAPSNTPTLSAVTVAQGTLQVGSTGGATAVLGPNLTLGQGTTGGTVDLNGFSPAAALTGLAVGGTSTANALTNTSATASTVALNLPADTSLPVQFGGNLVVNKNDATALTLTGNATLPATTTGVFNVNAGTLQLTGSGNTGLGSGMSVNVAAGATFNQTVAVGGFGSSSGPFGTITLGVGAQWTNAGTIYSDPTINGIVLTGGSVNFTSTDTAGTWITFATGGSVVSNASNTQSVITSTQTADRLNSIITVQVAQGTVPGNAADLRLGMRYVSTITKTGAGTLEIASPTGNAPTGPLVVSAGAVRVSTTSGSGTVTVNGGVLNGTGTVGGATTVNTGAFVQGGDPITPTGTLTVNANLTLTNNGGLRTVAGASSASLVSVSLAAGVLNLNPGAGNKFVINLLQNPADPLVAGQTYTYTLASVAAAGNIQLNGTALPDGTVAAGNYTLTGVLLSSSTLSVAGNNLVLQFVPVPEPLSVLAVAGLGLAAVRLRRRLA